MKSSLYLLLLLLLIMVLVQPIVEAQMNDLSFEGEEKEDYSFIFVGHIYGPLYPSSSFLESIPLFEGSEFVVLLGDTMRAAEEPYLNKFKEIINRITIPVFNAPGNHDMSNRSRYEKAFGEPYYTFSYNNEFFIILDTELHDGDIQGEQLKFLKDSIATALGDDTIKNVFIVSHKLIWSKSDQFKIVYENVNSNAHYGSKSNFEEEVLPELNKLAREKKTYFFSGDIGGSDALLPLFYHEADITYVATGLGSRNDHIIRVNISGEQILFEAIPLGKNTTTNIEKYNLEYWEDNLPDKTTKRIEWLYIRRKFISLYVGTVIILFIVLRRLYKHKILKGEEM